MGNASSTNKGATPVNTEKELVQPQTHHKPTESLSLLTLDELWEMCLKLNESVRSVSMIVNSMIFDEGERGIKPSSISTDSDRLTTTLGDAAANDVSNESLDLEFQTNNCDEQIETKFQAMTRLIQNLIHELTEQLDLHSKQVTRNSTCPESNAKLIKCVVSLVNNVNSYMTMLIKDIRKLGRLMSEGNCETTNVNQGVQKNDTIQDVISVTQDIDTMLMELRGSEKQREDLENDVISVMLICKDCREIRRLQEENLDSIEINIKLAAVSIDTGHSRKFRKF